MAIQVLSFFPTDIFVKECSLDLNSISQKVYNHQKNKKSENISNVGGYQGHEFQCEELFSEITRAIPNKQDNPIIGYQIFSWCNINKKGNYNDLHDHNACASSFLSGVFYVNAPENCGNIRFYDPRFGLTSAADLWYYKGGTNHIHFTPKNNLLLIFPSWLQHLVEPNNSNEDRISISFNIMAKFTHER